MAYYYESRFKNGGRDVKDCREAERIANNAAEDRYDVYFKDSFPNLKAISFAWKRNPSMGTIGGRDTQGKDGTVTLTFSKHPSAEELEVCKQMVSEIVIDHINTSMQLAYDLYMDPIEGDYHYEDTYEALPKEEKRRFFLYDQSQPWIEEELDFHEVERPTTRGKA